MNWRPSILDTSKPKYLAFVEALENDIAKGVLRHGDRLPPQREIADHLDMTVATVTKAIKEAIRKGIVTARTGSGTYIRVSETPPDAPRPAPDLSINSVPFSPAKPFLEDVLQELAGHSASERLFSYEPAAGSESHRSAMAKWLRKRGLSLGLSDISLTHGNLHGINACFKALTRPGDTILCEKWAYTGIRRLANFNHVRIAAVEMDAEGLDPRDLTRKIKATSAKVVICTPSVQNPTTATMSAERRADIVKVCAKHDVLIIEDDIAGLVSGDETEALAALDAQNVVYIGSVSKCFAPGFRLGALAAPTRLFNDLCAALTSMHWTAPSLYAEMLEILIATGAAERCLAAHRREAVRRLDIYGEIVGTLSGSRLPGYHVWQKVPAPWHVDNFVVELLSAGVRVSPSRHFAVFDGSSGDDNFVRICLGNGEDIDGIKAQLMRLKALMHSTQRLSTTIT